MATFLAARTSHGLQPVDEAGAAIVCPHCGMPLPEAPPPPEVAAAIRRMAAKTAEIIGAELDEDNDD